MKTAGPSKMFQDIGALGFADLGKRAAPAVRAALEKVLTKLDGGCLTREQCLRLAAAEGDDLRALIAAADQLRRALVGDVITYVNNRNINFTNVCFVGCKFC